MSNVFLIIKSKYALIILIFSLLALSSVSSYAATGSITISTSTIKPIIVGTTPNTSTLIVNGSYTLLTDSTPLGPSKNYICSTGANGNAVPYIPSQMGNVSFKNYATFNIDIGPLKYVGRGDIRTIGQVTPFGVRFDTLSSKMKPGSYTMKFYMIDSWMVTCPSYPWILKTDNITTVFASKMIDFIIKDLTPSVQVTLANTQVSDCETIAGSLTVNDPSGKGGSIALTLPDGSRQSFTYSANSSAPLPFSYAVSSLSGSTLNFSASVTSNSGETSKQLATATATVTPTNYTAALSVSPATVQKGTALQGGLTVSSTGTCPITGTATLDLYGQTQTIAIGQSIAAPFTFQTASIPAGSYQVTAKSIVINGQSITAAPASVTIIEAAPTVQATLAKTQVSGCETLTGSLTVNDPSGQGGTVALTLPDASTQSFTYASGAPSPIPFSYAVSGSVGSTLTFSATATSNSGASSKQPATATANVIAGGLSIAISTSTNTVEPTLPQRRNKAQNGANEALIIMTVNDSRGTPANGAQVTINIERASTKFGGHDHDSTTTATSNRPLGITSTVSNIGNGLYTATYIASEFAAEDKIRANVSFQGCSGNIVSSSITSSIFGLSWLQVPAPHVAIGGTPKHTGPNDKGFTPTSPDNNHWVTLKTNNTMSYLMTLYSLNYGAGLYINDASLPFGGKFDVNGSWSGSHDLHRRGIDLDIRLYDTANTSANEMVEANLKALELLYPEIEPLIFYETHGSGSNRHSHIYFW